ncbi:MAG: S4 domain-containing protein [Hyphomonadaceae bacterium]
MSRMRADLLLVARGLAESRAKARAAIEAGGVTANGALVDKPADLIAEDAVLAVTPPHPWVSRAAASAMAALDAFGLDPAGRVCLDVGASTGGFTQVLRRQRGAARVTLSMSARDKCTLAARRYPYVVSLERTDARTLTRTQIPGAAIADRV